MAANVEEIIMEDRPNSGDCLVETENCSPDPDGRGVRKRLGRKGRILYDREFLIKCFHNPASTRKPSGFPIPHLDCTLAASKVKRLPLSATPGPVKPVKRKEDGLKSDDNISLRPHSGNFPGGFGPPHPASPSHTTSNSVFGRILPHEDSSKGQDWDFHRNNFRFGNHRRGDGDRNRMDRDRDLDRDYRDRDRDRMNRDRISGSNHRNSNSWSDGPDGNDWPRRRNGAHFPRDRDYNTNRRYSNDRGRDMEEQEPEWFSGGPSSQHETIELRGFLDDDRRDKSETELQNGSEKENSEPSAENDSSEENSKNENARDSPMDLSIEKILKMDHIPGILSNELESEEPSGSSRFSQFFNRNSDASDFVGVGRKGHPPGPMPSENAYSNDGDKSKAVHEMGELLRNMLIRKNNTPSDQPSEPKVISEPSKPTTTSTSKDDVDAFKKLMTPLLEKVLQGPSSSSSTQKKPQAVGRSPVVEEGASAGGNVLDIFKQPPQQKAQVQQEEPTKNNPLQDIFNNMMNKQSNNSMAPSQPPPQGGQGDNNVPRMTAHQVLQMIPLDLQQLVISINVTQWDFIQLSNIAKNNEWTFRQVLETFMLRQCAPQQHMVFAGLLNLVIHGRLMLPGTIVTDCLPMNHPIPHPPMPQPMPNHRPQAFDGPKDMTKRSGTPVSSMAFTPTSVMRKMTADGNKSGPPPNPTGFVPVPISGGLLPTPPNTTPVMMNSNPNLVTLMSTMRPPMHMQFRPPIPAMGYPSPAGFHPSMMPPNIHGPVMLPPPFQNILPSQPPVYNNSKPEDN